MENLRYYLRIQDDERFRTGLVAAKEQNVNINAVDSLGWTLLHYCCWYGRAKCFSELLSSRIFKNVNATDSYGKTALHLAAGSNDVECISFLLGDLGREAGFISAKACSNDGWKAIHFATYHGCTESIRALIQGGLREEISGRDNYGDTPLHLAASCGQTSAIQELLSGSGRFLVDPSITNNKGQTPLHIAIQSRKIAAVKTLLKPIENDYERWKDGVNPNE